MNRERLDTFSEDLTSLSDALQLREFRDYVDDLRALVDKTLNQATIEKQKQQQTIFYPLFALAILIVLAISALIVLQWCKPNNLRELALTGELTGAPNRSAWMRAASVAFNLATAGHYSLIVAAIDLDRVKSINDRFGYNVGDEVLFTKAVHSVLSEQDTLARIRVNFFDGGGVFII